MTATERPAGLCAGITLVNLASHAEVSADPVLSGLLTWATSFLTYPHADLGRGGPVCPYTAPSLNRRLMWAAVVRGSDLTVDQVGRYADDLIELFRALDPRDESQEIYRSAMVIFPDLTDYSFIDTVQAERKPVVVPEGLMIGQFYPGCSEAGLWNAEFRPLDCPYPLIALRHMVSSDFAFLAARREWLTAYFKRFAPAIPGPVRSSIIDRMAPGQR
ncbi:hypothetical protein ONR57_04995 [Hoyosella sp. YIM 151337]|uniref:DUF6875 domain-containing protein n=1 Tax=Hoyosella sp. YIM 151337 TaxID=2992742 RepID=UPI002235BEEC|nr:hypothetical protein [Hoyosella sp. YIM 151337]MCW4352653.1 hypothetical protein [Hoyosella sp. YIM 151337]